MTPTRGQTLLDPLISPNEEGGGEFGASVAGVGGDVNADGVPDVIVGADGEDPGSSPDDAGRAYIFGVSASPVGLGDLPNGDAIALFPSPTESSFTLDLGTLRQATVRIRYGDQLFFGLLAARRALFLLANDKFNYIHFAYKWLVA